MIAFRCWYCGRSYALKEALIGTVRECGCGSRLRVPAESGGNSRARTLLDWVIEFLVYGGGGAFLGFGLGMVLARWLYIGRTGLGLTLRLVGICTLVGFLAGGLLGEMGINWVGRLIRQYEEKR